MPCAQFTTHLGERIKFVISYFLPFVRLFDRNSKCFSRIPASLFVTIDILCRFFAWQHQNQTSKSNIATSSGLLRRGSLRNITFHFINLAGSTFPKTPDWPIWFKVAWKQQFLAWKNYCKNISKFSCLHTFEPRICSAVSTPEVMFTSKMLPCIHEGFWW